MKTAARKIVKQRAKRLRVGGTYAKDFHLVGNGYISAVFTSTSASAVVGAVGVIFPSTAIGIDF